MSREKWITAEEHQAQLEKDPEWVARNAEREARLKEREEQFRREEAVLLSELRSIGFNVESVWDFVNTAEKYPGAIPVLLRHLSLPYHKRIKEGIIRALTVNYAGPDVLRALIRQFCEETDEKPNSPKWVMGNAISEVATPADAEAIIELATNPVHGRARDVIVGECLPRVVKDKARLREILKHLMQDEQMERHARRASRRRR